MKARYSSFTDDEVESFKESNSIGKQPTMKWLCDEVRSWLYQSCESNVCIDHPVYRWVEQVRIVLEQHLQELVLIDASKENDLRKKRHEDQDRRKPSIEAKNPHNLLYIIAEYRVNDCDSMTDYYGHTTKRTVLIGVKGKRCTEKLFRSIVSTYDIFKDMNFFWNKSAGYSCRDYELSEQSDPDVTPWEHTTGWHISASKWVPNVDEDWTK